MPMMTTIWPLCRVENHQLSLQELLNHLYCVLQIRHRCYHSHMPILRQTSRHYLRMQTSKDAAKEATSTKEITSYRMHMRRSTTVSHQINNTALLAENDTETNRYEGKIHNSQALLDKHPTTNVLPLWCIDLHHLCFMQASNRYLPLKAIPLSGWARNDITTLLVLQWHYGTWWWRIYHEDSIQRFPDTWRARQPTITTLDDHNDHRLWHTTARERIRDSGRRLTPNHEAADAAVEIVVIHANITTRTTLPHEWL